MFELSIRKQAEECLQSATCQACVSVLVLAGIELIFFIVAGMRLCFGFVLKSVDNTGMFSLLLSSTLSWFWLGQS